MGSAREPSRPAALVDPVRAQPFQVVLLDELEKAHPNVWDLLLPLLDEGPPHPARRADGGLSLHLTHRHLQRRRR
ncbi:MAG: AAA family ATPase [Deltaproteobacteria bacterium]|nr:AAA family ATPase [Deltaproteobacteria bacterium]